MTQPRSGPIELWGGVECTVSRVGEVYSDQLARSGHATRLDDLDRFAALGMRALRYPVLWERTAPAGLDRADWSWADARLDRIRALGVRPLVGLLHHGSGPRSTSLIDPEFPEQLAQYAGAVAARYPWVADYTPVNEPLTTARFSGLYGFWYPHGRDDATFVRALLNQCRATVLAMQAIRAANPRARLVQTEDLGKVFSTPHLAYQAEFENERRWLSLDLLCGLVDRWHPLWGYLRRAGAAEADLAWLRANPCPPDIIGINSYLTSERFLDHRLHHYPADVRASNGRSTYADVAAVHVRAAGMVGHRTLLREAWERYGLPLAVTEAHCGSTREEQLRWLRDVWQAAADMQATGVDVRAVTVWALLGAFDWSSLLTRTAGEYEPGPFDVRAPQPRPTALAKLARELAHGHTPSHPVLATPGWWQRPQRFCFGCTDTDAPAPAADALHTATSARPLLVTGAGGTLGRALVRACELRGLAYRALTRQELDITDAAAVEATLARLQPWALVNAAGYVRVDDAEQDELACMRANADGPATLAAACARHNVQLVTISSDMVFGGARDQPYVESDGVRPLNVYGHSKAEAERRVLHVCPAALVIRTSAFFGTEDDHDLVMLALRALARGERFHAADDQVVSPTYVPDLVHASLDLLVDGEAGVWHLSNVGAVTWAELARAAAVQAGYDPAGVLGVSTPTLGLRAARPVYRALGSARGALLPTLEHALARCVRAHAPQESVVE